MKWERGTNMFCNNCGAKIKNGAKFCTSCGKELKTSNLHNNAMPGESKEHWGLSISLWVYAYH